MNVPDLAAAKRYYDELAPMISFEPFLSEDSECAYQPADGKPGTFLFFYPALEASTYSRDQTGLQHLAFMVKSRGAVDLIHEHVVKAGGQILHAPRAFPEYPPPYYATFWLDPFGLMLAAVCHYDRD